MTKKAKTTRVLMIVGVLLVVGAVLVTVLSIVSQKAMSAKNDGILEKIYSLIPDVHAGTMDDRVDMDMPFLEVDGMDFSCVIEIPKYGTRLPVYGEWDKRKVSRFPCRYYGSIYDGSLIIGGSDYVGQFDFGKTIFIGDMVFITDMTGRRYSYEVEWVEKTEDVSTDILSSYDAELVLFMRNSYSLDYTLIRCKRT